MSKNIIRRIGNVVNNGFEPLKSQVFSLERPAIGLISYQRTERNKPLLWRITDSNR